VQVARQNQCRSVSEFLAALAAEHERVVKNGSGPSPLSLLRVDVPKAATSTSNDNDPMTMSKVPSAAASPRLRLKLSSAVAAAAAALAAGTAPSTSMSTQPIIPTTSNLRAPNVKGESSPFRINISVNSSQPHGAPPVPVIVASRSTKREDVDWYVDEGVDVRDEEWKPSTRSRGGDKKDRDHPSFPKSQSQSLHTNQVVPVPVPAQRAAAIRKKTTARQRLLKKVRR
jgi:hypothetical protein